MSQITESQAELWQKQVPKANGERWRPGSDTDYLPLALIDHIRRSIEALGYGWHTRTIFRDGQVVGAAAMIEEPDNEGDTGIMICHHVQYGSKALETAAVAAMDWLCEHLEKEDQTRIAEAYDKDAAAWFARQAEKDFPKHGGDYTRCLNCGQVSVVRGKAEPVEKEAEKVEVPPELSASEAVYGVLAWITCRADAVTLGATHDASIAAKMAGEFCKTNNLTEPRGGWEKNLTHPKTKAEKEPVIAVVFNDPLGAIHRRGRLFRCIIESPVPLPPGTKLVVKE